MIISLIAALSENRVIGREQGLPWHIPTDLKRFRKITSGHPVVMGRKTFDSVGKPLPNRINVVISRNLNLQIAGVQVVASLDDALRLFENTDEEVFVLGGGEIFNQAIGRADRLYLTKIHRAFDGDTYFPEFDLKEFELTFDEFHEEAVPFSFLDYKRRNR
jgi:dihydrofolate reductase